MQLVRAVLGGLGVPLDALPAGAFASQCERSVARYLAPTRRWRMKRGRFSKSRQKP